MTDLSDTTSSLLNHEGSQSASARQRRAGRASLWLGGAMLAASLVIMAAGSRSLQRAGDEPIGVVTAPLVTAPLVVGGAPQVASSPPTLPCVSWRFTVAPSDVLVVGGTPCVEMAVVRDGTPVLSMTLASSPAGIGAVDDPLLDMRSTAVTGQIYGDVLVMLEREPVSGVVSVVARSVTTFEPVWIQTCDAPTLVPSVHFSGGRVAQDVAANRTNFEVYGLTDYVAIGCGGPPALHDPSTGVTI